MFKLPLLSLLLSMIILVNGECPSNTDIPVMYDSNWFMCAASWHDYGATYAVDACNGDEHHYRDGYDNDPGEGYMIPMGSIFVKAGCTLYMYEWSGYNTGGEM